MRITDAAVQSKRVPDNKCVISLAPTTHTYPPSQNPEIFRKHHPTGHSLDILSSSPSLTSHTLFYSLLISRAEVRFITVVLKNYKVFEIHAILSERNFDEGITTLKNVNGRMYLHSINGGEEDTVGPYDRIIKLSWLQREL